MTLYDQWKAILKIQKFRRIVSYTGFYCFVAVLSYAYTSNTTRAGISRADQYYASYPAGIEMLTDTAKLYKAALANCFEEEEWGPIEFCIMAKHFERQGKQPYAYHAVLATMKYSLRYADISLMTVNSTNCTIFEALAMVAYTLMQVQYMAHLLSHGQLDGSGV